MSVLHSSLGASLVSAGLLHATYTGLVPWLTMGGITYALFVPAFFVGVVNLELKDAFVAIFAALPLTLLFTGVARVLPAFSGVVSADVFIFYEFGQVFPNLFALVPVFVIGLMAGILAGEFVFRLD